MISIIICSIDERKLDRVARNYASLLRAEEFEIIAIRDAKSLCEAYNRGVRLSKGETLIFSHDDIEILSPDFAVKLKHALNEHDVVGVVGTTQMMTAHWLARGQPHTHGVVAYPPGVLANDAYVVNVFGAATAIVEGIQGLDGLFFAAKRTVAETVSFDELTFDGFHGYDADFSFSAHLAGFKIAVCAEIIIAHQSIGNFGESWLKYNARFIQKHQAKLYTGDAGAARVAALKAFSVPAVLRFCEPGRLAEMTARLRN